MLTQYADFVAKMDIHPAKGKANAHLLGLVEEVGELAALHCKAHRKGTIVDPERHASELGDILWRFFAYCNAEGIKVQTIMQLNMEKLNDRASRNVIIGEGDVR